MSAEDDAQHLRLLSIFHYVVAGLTAAFSSFFLIHAGLGLTMLLRPGAIDGKDRPEPFAGWMFFAIGAAFVTLGWSLAATIGLAGRFLARRRHYTFCLVVAGFECALCFPFGTALGVFTIVVLLRPSAKELFQPPLAAVP
jgi:hypothetical protein